MLSQKHPIYLSIVIPAFNEERRLSGTLVPTIEFLKKQAYSSEIIVVSDGSTDRTTEVAKSFIPSFPALRVIEYFRNRGKGYAVKTGMSAAAGRYRLFMDADYAVAIDYLPVFLSQAKNGYDMVIASRALAGSRIESHQPFFRERAARLFMTIQRLLLHLPFQDTSCGFKLFSKDSAAKLFQRMTFHCAYFDTQLILIAYRSGMKISEVAVCWRHGNETRLPMGIRRTLGIIRRLIMLRFMSSSVD
ncbi:MAG: glycosyltransferase family 2 protein [Candidatus Aureabacteria bacterium]|nr:glycosyltransferase family 2 protein [Candidatus Auribacterota bacterium]